MSGWFEVDKAGLAALTARRGKDFILAELLSNAWDAPGTTRADVHVERVPGRPEAIVRVVDDSPDGFADLAHAFTLFAHTSKRADPQQRGRFNLGEKLSLAVAKEARIISTRGTIVFDASGRSTSRKRREAGSEIELRLPLTQAEQDAMLARAGSFIPPVPTTLNGQPLAPRTAVATLQVRLPTELQDAEGQMRRTERATQVDVYPAIGEGGWLYELGIPVCATGDTFDVDVRQKVPLSLERESVTDAYLRRVRAAVLAGTAHLLDAKQAGQAWVSQALEARDLPADAVAAVVAQRYGDKAVVFDPSDAEANKLAVVRGYTVVHGGSFSGPAWESIRAAGALKPAGQVTPSPKPWAEDGQVSIPLEPTPEQAAFARWCQRMGTALLGAQIHVEFHRRFNDPWCQAAYAPGRLQFSVQALGKAWFKGPVRTAHVDLLLHEFGHHTEADHLSHRFSDALSHLGAKLALAVRADPTLLDIEHG